MTRLSRLNRSATSCASDRRGTSGIELAFVAPLMILLVLGAVDTSLGFASKLKLEQAATRTVEQTVAQGPGIADYAYVPQAAADASGQPLSNVAVDKWYECDGVRMPISVAVCAPNQTMARFLTIRIVSTFNPPFDYSAFAATFGGTFMGQVNLAGSARTRLL